MIDRYSVEKISNIWGDDNKIATWMRVELAAITAMANSGYIPEPEAKGICECIQSYIEYPFPIRMATRDRELQTKHDLAAFVDVLAEQIEFENGKGGRWVHFGLTSSDVVDTALSLQIQESLWILNDLLVKLIKVVEQKAAAYKAQPIMGRTHGMHAEPLTVGLMFERYVNRLYWHLNGLSDISLPGKLSGAVGTNSHLNLETEVNALQMLGLQRYCGGSQIIERDLHADILLKLANLGAFLEKIAIDIRSLQRTEVGELQESFGKNQKGSSAMPHKKNPVLSENITGLARVLRGNAITALENVGLWMQRDISHSSAERIIFPDSFHIICFMTKRMARVMENLQVNTDRMNANIEASDYRWATQGIMLKLITKGKSRDEAYKIVQSIAMNTYDSDKSFAVVMTAWMQESGLFSEREIKDCFSLEHHLRNV